MADLLLKNTLGQNVGETTGAWLHPGRGGGAMLFPWGGRGGALKGGLDKRWESAAQRQEMVGRVGEDTVQRWEKDWADQRAWKEAHPARAAGRAIRDRMPQNLDDAGEMAAHGFVGASTVGALGGAVYFYGPWGPDDLAGAKRQERAYARKQHALLDARSTFVSELKAAAAAGKISKQHSGRHSCSRVQGTRRLPASERAVAPFVATSLERVRNDA